MNSILLIYSIFKRIDWSNRENIVFLRTIVVIGIMISFFSRLINFLIVNLDYFMTLDNLLKEYSTPFLNEGFFLRVFSLTVLGIITFILTLFYKRVQIKN